MDRRIHPAQKIIPMTFQLSPGLEVMVSQLRIASTYEGALEGDPEIVNDRILRREIPYQAARAFFGSTTPLGLPIDVRPPAPRQPPAEPQPWWRLDWQLPASVCSALLEGPAVNGAPDTEDMGTSGAQVAYCWLTDDIGTSDEEIISRRQPPSRPPSPMIRGPLAARFLQSRYRSAPLPGGRTSTPSPNHGVPWDWGTAVENHHGQRWR